MEKQEIDKRDLELLKKIAAKIKKMNKAAAKKTTQKIIVVLSIAAIAVLSVYVALKRTDSNQYRIVKKDTTIKFNSGKQRDPEEKQSVQPLDTIAHQVNPQLNIDIESDNTSFQKKVIIPGEMEENRLPVSKKAVIDYKNKRNISEIVESDNKKKGSLLRIYRCYICSSINNRNPEGIKKIFYLAQDKFVFVWTDVRTNFFPTSINHIYYLNGEKICTVPLEIKYPRMRTWSQITLNNYAATGRWQVDIAMDDGRILKQTCFEVR